MMLNIRIRKARLTAGLTQAELAKRLGVSRSAVANWERAGNIHPCTFRLGKIAVATQVSHEWLSTGRGQMTYRQDLDEIPAVDADLVFDPLERRMLWLFRSIPSGTREAALKMMESHLPKAARIPVFW